LLSPTSRHRLRDGRRVIIVSTWISPIQTRTSSRWLDLASMAEVLTRASFGEKQPDAPSEAALVRGPRALTSRAFRLEKPSPAMLQPLTSHVTLWAPLKQLRDRFIG
jgi:hypothetical protein